MSDEAPIEIPPNFRGLDPDLEITRYKINLPHWRQAEATYFVTFRLADALPQTTVRDLELERRSFRDRVEQEKLEGADLREATEAFSKLFGQRLDDHLDKGHGSCALRDPIVSKIVTDALQFFHGERYELYESVVMPNHCHVLVRPLEPHTLEDILESWKGFTARRINQHLKRSGNFWQQESYDRIVRHEEHYRKVVRYIRANPENANLPPGAYRFTGGRTPT